MNDCFQIYHLQEELKFFDFFDFLKKHCSLPNLPDDIILYIVDVVGLYPNIPHGEVLSALRERLDLRQEKDVTTSTLVELAEVVLKNNIFTFVEET